MFCKHNYAIIDKHETKSAFELTGNCLETIKPWLFKKRIIYKWKCKECNKIKTEEHEIGGLNG